MSKFGNEEKANICFDCRRACGGCSWSSYDPKTGEIRFQPVSGWVAVRTVILNSNRNGKVYLKTWHVTACPLFEPDPPRESNPAGLTEEQLRRVMRGWS